MREIDAMKQEALEHECGWIAWGGWRGEGRKVVAGRGMNSHTTAMLLRFPLGRNLPGPGPI